MQQQPGYYPPQPPQQHQQQQHVVVVQQPATFGVQQPPPPTTGKLGTHVPRAAVQRCGILLIVFGALVLVGQILETIGFGVLFESDYGDLCSPNSDDVDYMFRYFGYGRYDGCTFVSYAGYWCGVIVSAAVKNR